MGNKTQIEWRIAHAILHRSREIGNRMRIIGDDLTQGVGGNPSRELKSAGGAECAAQSGTDGAPVLCRGPLGREKSAGSGRL
jgi:hypothetical protein